MDKQKKFFVILLFFVAFISGLTVGFWQNKQTDNNNKVDNLTKKIKSYNPAAVAIYWTYFGVLNELSDNRIILTDHNGKKKTILLNNDMRKIMLYDFRINALKHLPADKTNFSPGAKIIYALGANWLSNKITNSTLELDLRK